MYHHPVRIFDVAVVGAGPSGAWTACLLARRGARVALIDPSHPREKPCGGGVTGRALALLADTIDLDRLPAVRIRQARFAQIDAGTSATVALRQDPSGSALMVASRREFDGLLVAAARDGGAALVHARVREVAREHAGFRIETSDGQTLHTAFLVGADGANSLVRRRVSRPFRRDQLSIATGFFAMGVSSDEILVELMTDPPGYLWSFPRPDHLAIGICAQADTRLTASALRDRTAQWIRRADVAPGRQLVQYSWPIPSLSADDFDALDVGGPHWLLAGDAAGLVDPITREGIFFALKSAELAAAALGSTLPRPDRRYAEAVKSTIAGELASAARFKARFFQPRFTRLLLDALNKSAAIRAVMADLFAGTQAYGDLKWRLAKTMELGLAWRALARSG